MMKSHQNYVEPIPVIFSKSKTVKTAVPLLNIDLPRRNQDQELDEKEHFCYSTEANNHHLSFPVFLSLPVSTRKNFVLFTVLYNETIRSRTGLTWTPLLLKIYNKIFSKRYLLSGIPWWAQFRWKMRYLILEVPTHSWYDWKRNR